MVAWSTVATADDATVCEWWRRWADANVAIATGARSGLVVLDLDARDGVTAAGRLRQLREVVGDLPLVATVETGGGGLHLYFRHPGHHVGNRAGLLPGIDLRGDGGYVIAPPSRLDEPGPLPMD